MKKYLRIILMMILIIILIIAFLFLKHSPQSKIKDDEIEIIQEISSGIPFQWTYRISNNKLILSQQYDKPKHPGKHLNGGKIEKHYIFKAQSPGESEVIFAFESLFNESEPSLHQYFIEIDENLHPRMIQKE